MDSIKRIELEQIAGAAYDGGWRTSDKEDLQKEYGFTDDELEIVMDKLAEIENR